MKESIGGSKVFIFAIIFLIAFTMYIAFSTNYSKTFKIKNEIIKTIERDSCFRRETGVADAVVSTEHKISEYLGDVFYATVGDCDLGEDEEALGATHYVGFPDLDRPFYCVKRIIEEPKMNENGVQAIERAMYYKVKVFFSFDIPFLNSGFTFAITGNTKNMIYTTLCPEL